ncbi:UNVERIFIED_CONTAM: hypothetical protein O8I53_06385 [Campylobacter lari]
MYNRSANFNFSNTEKFSGGLLTVKGTSINGFIDNLFFEGDFLSKKEIREIEPLFKGVHLDENSLNNILDKIDISDYFGTIKKEEIIKLILG